MSEKPILFNAEMVRAILDGRKTQTRRVIKPQPVWVKKANWWLLDFPKGRFQHLDFCRYKDEDITELLTEHYKCPYGKPGDLLWVREIWRQGRPMLNGPDISGDVAYRADYANSPLYNDKIWKPSIHMPRWAARIWLEITGVRVEQVQDISEEDAPHEGWPCEQEMFPTINTGDKAKRWFHNLWNSLNAKRGYPWEMNPFVWVIEFKRQGKE